MVSNQIKIQDTLKLLRKEEPKIKISREDYAKLCSLFFKFLSELLLQSYTVTLPARLGQLCIVGKKINFERFSKIKHVREVNWKATKELREKGKQGFIYYLNEHTDYVRYSLKWYKKQVPIINKHFYCFTACRFYQRKRAQKIKEGQEFLIEV